MKNLFGHKSGFKVIEDINMTKEGEPYDVKRTLRERFFTRPFRPFVKTYSVTPMIPRTDILRMGNTLIMHPAQVDKLREPTK